MISEKGAGIGVSMLVTLLACGVGQADAAAAPVSSWEGFYLGADVGYGFGVTAAKQPVNTDFLGSHGFTGGVLAGYNHMVAPRWLLGVEEDASWSDIAATINDGYGDVAAFAQKQGFSLRARVGYLLAPETLLYGTGGWGWSQFTYSLSESFGSFSESDTRWLGGLQVGAGIETMLAPNWSVRLEYLQTFYNSGTLNSTFYGPIDLRPSVGVARIALAYRFGSGEAAPWAAPPAKPTWDGAYVGGVLAAGAGNAKVDFSQSPGTTADGVGVQGVFPTFLIGYNWRVAPRWVVGVEGEVAPGISTSTSRSTGRRPCTGA